MKLRNSGYQPEIDGLRAIAVLAVVANHFYEPILAHGYLGVDIFFVISGYVITKSLQGYSKTSVFSSVKEFYSRRINRLMPALLACVTFTCLFAVMFTPEPRTTLTTGAASLFGLSNLYLFRISANYFDNSTGLNYFTHTWSLGVEEQFYFIIPILFFFLSLHVRASARVFIMLIIVASVASLSGFLYLHDRMPNLTFFMMPFRFWELAAGILVFYITRLNKEDIWLPKIDVRLPIVLLLFVLSLSIIPKNLATVLAVLLTAFILAQLNRNVSGKNVLCIYPLAIIGLMSYSLYLWHWSVLVLARWTVGVSISTAPFLLFVMLGLSYLSYSQIELKFRVRTEHRYFRRFLQFSMFGCLVLAATLLATATQTFVDPYLGTRNAHLQRVSDITTLDTIQRSGEQMDIKLKDIRARCNMTPEFSGAGAFTNSDSFNESSLDECLGLSSTPKLILLGDSFSSVVAEHLMYISESLHYDFNFLYGYNCPYPLDKKNIQYATLTECMVDPQAIQTSLIEQLLPGDIVVIRLFFQSTVYANLPINNFDSAVQAYDKELESLIKRIKEKNAGILLLGTNSAMPNESPCSLDEWFNRYQCDSSDSVSIRLSDLPHNLLAKFINLHLVEKFHEENGVTRVINPLIHLCGDESEICPLIGDGKVYMRDTYHLSQVAVDAIYGTLLKEVENLSTVLSSGTKPTLSE